MTQSENWRLDIIDIALNKKDDNEFRLDLTRHNSNAVNVKIAAYNKNNKKEQVFNYENNEMQNNDVPILKTNLILSEKESELEVIITWDENGQFKKASFLFENL